VWIMRLLKRARRGTSAMDSKGWGGAFCGDCHPSAECDEPFAAREKSIASVWRPSGANAWAGSKHQTEAILGGRIAGAIEWGESARQPRDLSPARTEGARAELAVKVACWCIIRGRQEERDKKARGRA